MQQEALTQATADAAGGMSATVAAHFRIRSSGATNGSSLATLDRAGRTEGGRERKNGPLTGRHTAEIFIKSHDDDDAERTVYFDFFSFLFAM